MAKNRTNGRTPTPTLNDVAERAGVSLATASRAINGSTNRSVRADLRRVEAAAAELGYTANLSAQATARGTSAIIGLLVADIADPYFGELASGVARGADEAGLIVNIAVTERDSDREVRLVRALRGQRPKGLILAASRMTPEIEPELRRELELVSAVGGRTVAMGVEDEDVRGVIIDNRGGAEALARALRLTDPERELLFRLAGLAVPGAGTVPTRVPPSVQRLLDRLADSPVAVYDATWTLVVANAAYDALLGATTAWRGIERNALWRHLVGPGSRVVHTAEDHADLVAGLVGDLRLTAARYPADPRVRRLVAELGTLSPRFVELWESAEVARRDVPSRHKVVDHPAVGRLTVDCDTLVVAGDDLRVMVYGAEPGTDDAERLALAVVLGTQAFVG